MSPPPRPELIALALADRPAAWRSLGFSTSAAGVAIGQVWLGLGASGHGITGWRVSGLESEVDGLPLAPMPTSSVTSDSHPNGAIGIDHVVVLTPDFERTAAALAQAGLELRRIRSAPGAVRQGFRRLGPTILELVQAPDIEPGPARFWGLVVIVQDLDELALRLGDRVGRVKDAVQPGRRIATLRASAGLGQAVAFMDPEPAP